MSAVTAARPYGGVPAEDRRAARRERLLDAGLELLGTRGYAGTTVRGVCAQAQLTPRYFYESFDDLDALVVAVFDRLISETTDATLAAFAAAPDAAYSKARAAIETFVVSLTDDPRRARVAFIEARGSERLLQRRLETMQLFAELLATLGREFYGSPEDPLSDLTATVLVGGMAELLIRWLDDGLDITRDQLIEDFTELFVATGESAVALARRRAGKR